MAQSNLEVVRDHFAATNEGDFAKAMSHYSDDVELLVSNAFLDIGTFRGKYAVGQWFGEWFGTSSAGISST